MRDIDPDDMTDALRQARADQWEAHMANEDPLSPAVGLMAILALLIALVGLGVAVWALVEAIQAARALAPAQ